MACFRRRPCGFTAKQHPSPADAAKRKMDKNEKFYTQIPPSPWGQKFPDASGNLTYAIMEASHSGRTLLVPRIELNKNGNFHIPAQSSLADYFDLPKTVVTHKKEPLPFSCIGTAEWPDTTGCSVANLKPDEPLNLDRPEQLVVRYLPVAKSYFPARYGHRIKISGKESLWMRESYKETTVRLQLAPLWKSMADQAIESLGGEGAYRILVFRRVTKKRKKINTIVAKESKVLKAIKSDIAADRPLYLIYERSLAGRPYRQLCDAIAEKLSRQRDAFFYRNFPDMRALIETENLLILDNHALIAIEQCIQEAAQEAFTLILYDPEEDA